MEIIVLLGLVAVIGYFVVRAVYNKAEQGTDAAAAPYKVEDKIVAAVKDIADVNNDGKVNLADAKAVVNKAAKTVAKKTAAPKKAPAAKPAPAKKAPAAKPAPAKKAPAKKAPVKKPATTKK